MDGGNWHTQAPRYSPDDQAVALQGATGATAPLDLLLTMSLDLLTYGQDDLTILIKFSAARPNLG